jgi:hypothetical protein
MRMLQPVLQMNKTSKYASRDERSITGIPILGVAWAVTASTRCRSGFLNKAQAPEHVDSNNDETLTFVKDPNLNLIL